MIEKKRGRPRKIPTIVCDNDDTIVNFLSGLCKVFNKRYGTCITENDLATWNFDDLLIKDARGSEVKGEDIRKTFMEYENHGLYVGLDLLESSYDALKWMKKLGYKVIILTARDEKYGKDTELNLIFNNIAQFVDEVYFEKDKVKKIQELSKTHKICLFADDKASTVNAVAEGCKVDHIILIDKAHNRNEEVVEDVKRLRTLFEAVRFLKDYSEEA